MKLKRTIQYLSLTLIFSVIHLNAATSRSVYGQTLENQRRQGVEMLEQIKKDIKKNYYDPTFRGADLDAQFKVAEEKVNKATSIGEVLGIAARVMMEFNDSHTYFIIPPPRDYIEQGWVPQMIGDKCYVIAVKPGSDAEAKGLKPGDEILSMGGSTPTRTELWKAWYFLRYQPGINLVVRTGNKPFRSLAAMAKIKPGKAIYNLRSVTGSDWVDLIRQWETQDRLWRDHYMDSEELLIWKMPSFDSLGNVDEIMGKARKRKALIIDLRRNGGGYEEVLLRLVGYLFDHDIKIGDIKSRTESKPLTAKTRGAGRIFTGKLVLLIDGNSGSAAELLSRVVQMEKRGIVIGDVSSGKVMRSMAFSHLSGMDQGFYYGVNVTIADLIMTDGKSLERVGVTPDDLLLPTSDDMAAGFDPVLSRAAKLAGFDISAAKAGTFFPIEWPD